MKSGYVSGDAGTFGDFFALKTAGETSECARAHYNTCV